MEWLFSEDFSELVRELGANWRVEDEVTPEPLSRKPLMAALEESVVKDWELAALSAGWTGFRDEGRLPEGSADSLLGKLGDEAREDPTSKRLTTVGIREPPDAMAESILEGKESWRIALRWGFVNN